MTVISWLICLLFVNVYSQQAQYYYGPAYAPQDQNASVAPYPYQTALGLTPLDSQGMGTFPPPYPYMGFYPGQVNMNAYYAMLAQQGRPVYPGYPFYPQYAPQGQGFGWYPQFGGGYPIIGFGVGAGASQPGNGDSTQTAKETNEQQQFSNIKTEILDVSPEYQRQLLGWPTNSVSKPRYTVDINQQTSNVTNVPVNLTKPIVTEKRFITSIRRTFVYDSSKPEPIKPINIHIINGQHVTTTAPPETTVNEDVQGTATISTVNKTGRRYMDVPKTCPRGTKMTHTGECIEPFLLRQSTANETHIDENAIEA